MSRFFSTPISGSKVRWEMSHCFLCHCSLLGDGCSVVYLIDRSRRKNTMVSPKTPIWSINWLTAEYAFFNSTFSHGSKNSDVFFFLSLYGKFSVAFSHLSIDRALLCLYVPHESIVKTSKILFLSIILGQLKRRHPVRRAIHTEMNTTWNLDCCNQMSTETCKQKAYFLFFAQCIIQISIQWIIRQ